MSLTALDFVFFGILLMGLSGEYFLLKSRFKRRHPFIYYVRLRGWPATYAWSAMTSDLSIAAVALYVLIRMQ